MTNGGDEPGGRRRLACYGNCDTVKTMKNITVTLPDEAYRRARIRAAELNTSVSAMVREFLLNITEGETATERLRREERELRGKVGAFRAGERLDREAIHRRGG
jgi:plasmid stability protein